MFNRKNKKYADEYYEYDDYYEDEDDEEEDEDDEETYEAPKKIVQIVLARETA